MISKIQKKTKQSKMSTNYTLLLHYVIEVKQVVSGSENKDNEFVNTFSSPKETIKYKVPFTNH